MAKTSLIIRQDSRLYLKSRYEKLRILLKTLLNNNNNKKNNKTFNTYSAFYMMHLSKYFYTKKYSIRLIHIKIHMIKNMILTLKEKKEIVFFNSKFEKEINFFQYILLSKAKIKLKKKLKNLDLELLNVFYDLLSFNLQKKLEKLPRNSLPVRIVNRCELTGRARGYYREWAISRIMFRTLANQGNLSGVFKASW
uniref:30s ribosomal protein s14 n=1 Tax=Prototheca stagnorum TaxID=215448 RepID=A0A2Z6BEP2_9CHLO|nr:30s ribosomal protein s14 [Prototheca stagnorum]BBD20192.1 30s ribosomal protein s14 [Prototheca stagnorum]